MRHPFIDRLLFVHQQDAKGLYERYVTFRTRAHPSSGLPVNAGKVRHVVDDAGEFDGNFIPEIQTVSIGTPRIRLRVTDLLKMSSGIAFIVSSSHPSSHTTWLWSSTAGLFSKQAPKNSLSESKIITTCKLFFTPEKRRTVLAKVSVQINTPLRFQARRIHVL